MNWIRLYFHRKPVSSSSLYHCTSNFDIFPKNLYHATVPLRNTYIQPTRSNLTSEVISVPNLLRRLNTLNDFSTTEEIAKDTVLLDCIHHLPSFTNDQLFDLMDSLHTTKCKDSSMFYKNPSIRDLLTKLDQECLHRSMKMDLESVIKMMGKYSEISRSYSAFIGKSFARNVRRVHNRPVPVMVEFARIVKGHRLWGNNVFRFYDTQFYLENNIHQMNIQQIVVLLESLSQMTKSIVSFDLKKMLLSYVVNNFDSMDHHHLYRFLHFFCLKDVFGVNLFTLTPEFVRLLDAAEEKFDLLSLNCLACVGFLTTRFLIHRPEFLHKLFNRFLQESDRTTRTISDFVIYTSTFFGCRSQEMVTFIKSNNAVSYKHTRRYVRLISWLCQAGIFDYEVINEVLDQSSLVKIHGSLRKFTLYPHPLIIDQTIQIECPDYSGNRLSPKIRNDLITCYNWNLVTKHSIMDIQTDQYQLTNNTEQFNATTKDSLPYHDILKDISSKLEASFGCDCTHLCYVLPHMPRPNLLLCVDNEGSPRSVAHLKHTDLVPWDTLDPGCKWYVVTVLIRNPFLNTEAEPLGTETTKIRQLRKLNFNVTAVVQDQWLSMSEDERKSFCVELIK